MFNSAFTTGFFTIAIVLCALQAASIAAKLGHYITFSWWFVLMPLWLAILLLCGLVWLMVYIADALS